MVCDVMIVKVPTDMEERHGVLEEVLWRGENIVAKDVEAARLIAAEHIPEKADRNRLEVRVVPFGPSGTTNSTSAFTIA